MKGRHSILILIFFTLFLATSSSVKIAGALFFECFAKADILLFKDNGNFVKRDFIKIIYLNDENIDSFQIFEGISRNYLNEREER